jgi:hypothetical protein
MLAQSNPVPLVNNPLAPVSIAPGSKTFTLTVNGTGFAPTAVVNWNGSPRPTGVISSSQMQATITSSDVAKASTAWVTVTNPTPGGGTSNVVFFPITREYSNLATSGSQAFNCAVVGVADFNNDGKLDVACAGSEIAVSLGNGNGTFQSPVSSPYYVGSQIVAADFNGDGKVDIAGIGLPYSVVLLGNGDGTFTQSWSARTVGGNDYIAAADFNGDGKLDLYITGWDLGQQWFQIYLGNGDGTFSLAQQYSISYFAGSPAIGDFNSDGKLDLAIPEDSSTGGVDIWLGNGDGSFSELGSVLTGSRYAITADMNHDGKLDLLTDSGCILLGNGNGTFGQPLCVQYGGIFAGVGDFNGDGIVDAAQTYILGLTPFIDFLVGAGDGTFPASFTFSDGFGGAGGSVGDFNNDGKLDVITSSGFLLIQSTVSLTPDSISFGDQNVGTSSQPQTAVLTNIASAALTIRKIFITGSDPNDFSQSDNCGSSLAAGASCTITITFRPKTAAVLSATLEVNYVGAGSPEIVTLSGIGIAAATVSLTPSSLTYPTQLVGTTSPPQVATLTNTGGQTVTISNISVTGPFLETNNCPSSLGVGGSCQISVTFEPTGPGDVSGRLSVSDNAAGSPQSVQLSGTGTVITLSPIGVNFGNQPVDTTSAPANIMVTNSGTTRVAISQVTFTGADPGDFAETNNCGNGLAGGSSCTIRVTFTPTTTGQRSANLSVTDNGGGSPQTVPLVGTGT